MTKATSNEIDLHNRVLTGDDVASSQVFVLYGDKIVEYLKQVFSKVAHYDSDVIFEGVTDAFISYSKHPNKYNPELMTLFDYLKMAAKADMKNVIQRKVRAKKKIGKVVELKEIEYIRKGSIFLGIGEFALYESIGKPLKTNTTVVKGLTHKQCIYGNGVFIYVENGVVSAWQNIESLKN